MQESESEVTQSCPTLSDPMNYSLPGSSVHGIFQARVLEWGAIAFSEKCNLGIYNTASCITVLVYVFHLPQGRISIALQCGAMIQIHGW